jgi:dihydroneopterin aldolase
MKLTIDLKGMRFYAFHGVSQQERITGNDFRVDISYTFPAEKIFGSDDLHDTVSYADVYETVKAEMAHPSQLLEHVAWRIICAVKAAFPQLARVRLTVSKLNPPICGEIDCASVTLEA